ncbi:MAG TPA: hypothetical protein V6D25_20100 [Leptolyngbyaceae cyanobacterium]
MFCLTHNFLLFYQSDRSSLSLVIHKRDRTKNLTYFKRAIALSYTGKLGGDRTQIALGQANEIFTTSI